MADHPKLAHNNHPIMDLMRRRWSGRAFDSRPLPHSTLAAILEAARWAPSSGNSQPWRFIVLDGRDAAARADGEALLADGNAWAKRAPVLLIGVAREVNDKGAPTVHGGHDLGLATQNLMLQAFALGLTVHAMGGFSREEARRRFSIPTGFAPLTMLAIGYPGDPEMLDEKHRAQETTERTRKPLGEIAFDGAWEKPFRPS